MAQVQGIWQDWHIEEEIGRGSFGCVYRAVKRDIIESHSAIKVISIPNDPAELESLYSEGLTEAEAAHYYKQAVDSIAEEIQVMRSIKGKPHIVSLEDYSTEKQENGIGWNIYIRMELLTPLSKWLSDKEPTEEAAIKLGKDMCAALAACHAHSILHRDIKPDNIFVDDDEDFKLGDFGISRKLGSLTQHLTRIGTPNFMSPEVYNGQSYDSRADIYSLGLVLFWLLNKKRLPFLGADKALLSTTERRESLARRMSGDAIPTPCNASAEMAQIIQKACAYKPEDRYQSAEEMKQALSALQTDNERNTDGLSRPDRGSLRQNKKRSAVIAAGVGIAACILGTVVWIAFGRQGKKEEPQPTETSTIVEATASLPPTVDLQTEMPEQLDSGNKDENDEKDLENKSYVEQGWEACDNGQYKDAFDLFTKAINEENDVLGLRGLGYLYYHGKYVQRNYSVALKYFERALKNNEDDTFSLWYCGRIWENGGDGIEQDYEKAFAYFEKAASKGYNDAYIQLGAMVFNGAIEAEDRYETAMSYFIKAKPEDAQYGLAANNLGMIYEHWKQYKTAALWYEKSAEKGDRYGLYNLGRMYLTGKGVQPDPEKAKVNFEKAAGLGHVGAIKALGDLYRDGSGVDQDYAKALQYYQDAVNAKDAIYFKDAYIAAIYEIGNLYYFGNYGKVEDAPDYGMALSWYLKGVTEDEQTNAVILLRIGDMYYNGMGADSDPVEADKWYSRYAQSATGEELFRIGYEYGVQKEYTQAEYWYLKAVDAGNAGAMYNLGLMYWNGEVSGNPEYDKAFKYFSMAADAGNANSMFMLGLMHEKGEVTGSPEYEEAYKYWKMAAKYWKMAADTGDAYAMYWIGNMYENGFGTDVDVEKALEWYQKALSYGYEQASEAIERLTGT